jgi:hypothetical protein
MEETSAFVDVWTRRKEGAYLDRTFLYGQPGMSAQSLVNHGSIYRQRTSDIDGCTAGNNHFCITSFLSTSFQSALVQLISFMI